MHPQDRLRALNLVLPDLASATGSFAPGVVSGNWLYLSGKGAPRREGDGPVPRVGAAVTLPEAQAHAREAGLQLVAAIQQALGDLARVKRIVKVFGMVNATPDFRGHTEVVNGCSDLLVAVFGDRGVHARSAIGVASLPKGFAVEIEALVEFE